MLRDILYFLFCVLLVLACAHVALSIADYLAQFFN